MDIAILKIIILIFSVVAHEVSHGLAAYFLGDSTAKYAGRLSLNPLRHLDPWGSVIIPLLLIFSGAGVILGWAKPVPYNPYNLRNQKYGPAIVGVSGPLANIVLALIAGVLMRIMLVSGIDEGVGMTILALVIQLNIVLLVFNLLPIPPLDGSKLLFTFIPISTHTRAMMEQYGFVILLAFLFLFSDILGILIYSVLSIFSETVVGISLWDFLGKR